jgi:hypothetical protein
MTAKFIVGNAVTIVRTLPDASVDLVLTSPPFHRLRRYSGLPGEIGLELTPGEYIDSLLDVVEALLPKMAPHASLVVEIGDSMSGSGGSGGDYNEGGMREGQARWMGTARAAKDSAAAIPWRVERDGFPLDKSHELIPETFRFALAYGFNPLTGRETPKWRIRNVRPWVRTSPPVGALFDSFRTAHSTMVVACQSRRRWFDLDAVRTNGARDYSAETPSNGQTERDRQGRGRLADERTSINPAGAPPLDWFMHNPAGYEGAHYATWDEIMLVESVQAMCPRRVCVECGEPSWRITRRKSSKKNTRKSRAYAEDGRQNGAIKSTDVPDAAEYETIGWTCCGCGPACEPTIQTGECEAGWRWAIGPWGSKNQGIVHAGACDHSHWRKGKVLDPFAGTASTLATAVGHDRDTIGIDLDPRNLDLAYERLGMLLEVDSDPQPQPMVDVDTGPAL